MTTNTKVDSPFCTVVTKTDEFESLRDSWADFSGDNVFMSWEWLSNWWNSYSLGRQLCVILVRDPQGQPIGALPLYKTVNSVGTRVLSLMANGKACSDYVGVVCDPKNQKLVERTAAQAIMSNPQVRVQIGRWDSIELEGHSANQLNVFKSTLQEHGCRILQNELEGCWNTILPDSYQEFESDLKKYFRRKTRKAEKRIEDERFKFILHQSPEQIDQVWSVFCELHQRRRETLGDAGCFTSDRFSEFLRSATMDLAKKRKVSLIQSTFEDQDLGFLLLFKSANRLWMYQSGFNVDQMKLEPGHLLVTWAIKHAIESGVEEFDFLRGDESYKRFWNTTRIPVFNSKIVAPTISARLKHNVWLAGKSVKDQLLQRQDTQPTILSADTPLETDK